MGELHAMLDIRLVDIPLTGAFCRSWRPLLHTSGCKRGEKQQTHRRGLESDLQSNKEGDNIKFAQNALEREIPVVLIHLSTYCESGAATGSERRTRVR